jgi:hypothetical protein
VSFSGRFSSMTTALRMFTSVPFKANQVKCKLSENCGFSGALIRASSDSKRRWACHGGLRQTSSIGRPSESLPRFRALVILGRTPSEYPLRRRENCQKLDVSNATLRLNVDRPSTGVQTGNPSAGAQFEKVRCAVRCVAGDGSQ